jgi:Protein of unknown function (DUF2934)
MLLYLVSFILVLVITIFLFVFIEFTTKLSIKIPSHQEIAILADKYWIDAGRPKGRDREFWFAAKADLLESIMISHIQNK